VSPDARAQTLVLAAALALSPGQAKAGGKKRRQAAPAALSDPVPLGLDEVLRRAEQAAPSLSQRQAEANAAAAGIGYAKADILPQVDAQAIDSFGFPGSTGYLGIGGVMGSPYRSGLAGGIVVQQQIYDFGRTEAAVDAASQDVATKKERTRLEAQAVRLTALRQFYRCVRLRSEVALFRDLVDKTASVTKEVKGFVRTGQRSIVDRYLAQSQLEEAKTEEAVARARLGEAEGALGLVIGQKEPAGCPALDGGEVSWTPTEAPEANPLVAEAQAELGAVRARLDAVKARYMPKLDVLGSVGVMERARLVSKTPYAVGVGLSVPLFDGFREDYATQRGQAEVVAKEYEVAARKLDLAEINARYDEEIAAARAKLEHLASERKLAREGFGVARDRYRAAQGTLTDLREAIRNLTRTDQAYTTAAAIELEAVGAKELVNGGLPRS
jgi:outer membrane protein TolC